MPVADPATYRAMLDAAKSGKSAYPAINVSSSETLNAALRGFADAGSDGLIQVSTGGGEFASGTYVKDMALGAIALAEFAHRVADRYPIFVALTTDHCQPEKVETFVRPLLAESAARRERGEGPLFNGHMFDGSSLPLTENVRIAAELLEECAELGIVLEVEAGVVGGEEDGVSAEGLPSEKLYTTPEDMLAVADVLGTGDRGRYLFAATFGNVHGVYKPGNVKLRPEILREGQDAVTQKYGDGASFDLVFHGGSGSALEEIRETLEYGVVKMNVDTDAQYAFTRPIAGHMFTNYDGVLKVDGEVGNKKAYDPRTYLKQAEADMAKRVAQACEDLRSAGQSIFSAERQTVAR
jgi:fructose-bisphosphate aldolase, class II